MSGPYFVQSIKKCAFVFASCLCHLSDGHLIATETGITTTKLHVMFGYQATEHESFILSNNKKWKGERSNTDANVLKPEAVAAVLPACTKVLQVLCKAADLVKRGTFPVPD